MQTVRNNKMYDASGLNTMAIWEKSNIRNRLSVTLIYVSYQQVVKRGTSRRCVTSVDKVPPDPAARDEPHNYRISRYAARFVRWMSFFWQTAVFWIPVMNSGCTFLIIIGRPPSGYLRQWYSTFFVPVPPDLISLTSYPQSCWCIIQVIHSL
jgi:hypothetical protein